MFLNRKRFKPLKQTAQLTLMDDESLPIIGIQDSGFVIKAPIEKLSYYYNYDKKVEALFRVYGQSFYLCLSLSKISKSETLATVDLRKSNPYIAAIFLRAGEKNGASIRKISGNTIQLEDGRSFDIRTQLTQVPKNSLITYCFMVYLKEDKISGDIISSIERHYERREKDDADFAA